MAPKILSNNADAISPRIGIDWMDGIEGIHPTQHPLFTQEITIQILPIPVLPPYYRKLPQDMADFLRRLANANYIARKYLGAFWPFNFDTDEKMIIRELGEYTNSPQYYTHKSSGRPMRTMLQYPTLVDDVSHVSSMGLTRNSYEINWSP
jgi:hypothetical protein